MKKILFTTFLAVAFILTLSNAKSQSVFYKALQTCEPYSQTGGVSFEAEYYNIKITLDKSKNKCVYKEKIYQDNNWQLLTCNFEMAQLAPIASSMQRFNEAYAAQIAKNRIFEAKMTTNSEIFEKYLVNKKYCAVTSSTK